MPFTAEQFRDVFRAYNEAVWPMQWVLVAAAIAVVTLARAPAPRAQRLAVAALACMWIWVGAVYHAMFLAAITRAAIPFAALSAVQGVLLAARGVVGDPLRFDVRRDRAAVRAGGFMIVVALLLYPAIGVALGHQYPSAPTFGLPCPLTIFTFGVLLLARPPIPKALLVVPVLWSIVGTSAALRLGMWEDLTLPAAALATLALALRAPARRDDAGTNGRTHALHRPANLTRGAR
jgi:hypothetical protein